MFWRIVCPVVVASQVFPEALDDDVTLLQSKIGLHHAEVRVQPIQDQAETDANLASVANYLSEMEIRRDDGDGSWDTEEKTSLETMKAALTDQFKQFLDDEHADDSTTWTARKSVHQVCITHASNDFGTDGAVTAVSTAVTLTKNKHEGCRKSEKSWNDYKDLALTSCAGASDLDTVHEIYSPHEDLASAMSLAKTQAQDYANLAEVGSKRECNSDQLDYENKWCEWRDDRGWACAGLEGCIAQVDLAGLKSSLLVRSSNRRMLWLTIEKLLCRIDHLLTTFGEADTSDTVSDFNTTDTCDSTEADHTKFVLSLDIPPYTPCSDIGPGTEPGAPTCSAWLAQEYTWPTTTHVVPTTCQTSCPAVTFTTPTPHAGCASDSEKCSLYTAHPDVCGQYDGDLGVTSTDCCACAPLAPAVDWETVVELAGTGTTVLTDQGSAQFNSLFSACPVVQYTRNGAVHSVYVRTSAINIDAYQIFTALWESAENMINQDFKIYDSLADAEADQNSWDICVYDHAHIGYPLNCGKTGQIFNTWFTMPGTVYPIPGISSGAKFEIFTGSDCPSAVR